MSSLTTALLLYACADRWLFICFSYHDSRLPFEIVSCINMYKRRHACICVSMHVCMHVFVHAFLCVCLHVCIHVFMYMYVCIMYICIYMCILYTLACMYVCMDAYCRQYTCTLYNPYICINVFLQCMGDSICNTLITVADPGFLPYCTVAHLVRALGL